MKKHKFRLFVKYLKENGKEISKEGQNKHFSKVLFYKRRFCKSTIIKEHLLL